MMSHDGLSQWHYVMSQIHCQISKLQIEFWPLEAGSVQNDTKYKIKALIAVSAGLVQEFLKAFLPLSTSSSPPCWKQCRLILSLLNCPMICQNLFDADWKSFSMASQYSSHHVFSFSTTEAAVLLNSWYLLLQLSSRWWSAEISAPLFTQVSKTYGHRSDEKTINNRCSLASGVLVPGTLKNHLEHGVMNNPWLLQISVLLPMWVLKSCSRTIKFPIQDSTQRLWEDTLNCSQRLLLRDPQSHVGDSLVQWGNSKRVQLLSRSPEMSLTVCSWCSSISHTNSASLLPERWLSTYLEPV